MGYEVPPEFTRKAAAPAVATAPVATAPVATAEVTFETVLHAWDKVREAAKQRGASLSRTLERSRPKALNGRRLTIEASVASFLFSQLETPAFRDPLSELLKEALGGATLELSFERGTATAPLSDSGPHAVAGAAAPAPSGSGPAVRSVYDEPIVKHAQRVLGSQSTTSGW